MIYNIPPYNIYPFIITHLTFISILPSILLTIYHPYAAILPSINVSYHMSSDHLYIHPSILPSIHLSIHLFIYHLLSICHHPYNQVQSILSSIHTTIYPNIHPTIYPSIHSYIHPSIYLRIILSTIYHLSSIHSSITILNILPSIHSFIFPSIHIISIRNHPSYKLQSIIQSINPSIHQSINPSIYLSKDHPSFLLSTINLSSS
jgi:hypothetical protein